MKMISKNDEVLKHFGILGMHWGIRRDRVGFTDKRQKTYTEKDLKRLKDGDHLSTGFTKKRQSTYDVRDTKRLTKKLESTEKNGFHILRGKKLVGSLIGFGGGMVGARTLISLTPLALSGTVMYVGGLLGGVWGSRLVVNSMEENEKE